MLALEIVFNQCALHKLNPERTRSVTLFGEIRISSPEGFFNGKISAIITREELCIDIFSLFGLQEMRIIYKKGECLFMFPRENRIWREENCTTIEIWKNEKIEIESLRKLFLEGRGGNGIKILSYRIFHRVRYPAVIVWKEKDIEVKLKIKDVEFNKIPFNLFMK